MSSATDTAKIFTTGRSQAVRLPKAYRFDTAEVFIEKIGNTVILRPKQDESMAWGERLQSILSAWQGVPEEIERDHNLPVDDIESLD
jgi:antitoxin VapB